MMNYSDYDSDGYSSNEDKDYEPSDDNLSEDDMNECVKEDGLEGDEPAQPDDITKKKGKKRKGKEIGVRKRKKGGLKLEEDGPAEEKRAEPQEEEEGHPAAWTNKEDKEEKQKKKADDLWASFLSDVGTRPKPAAPEVQSSKPHQVSPIEEKQRITAPADPEQPEQPEPKASQTASKVTITKVFDFAGEEVRVTKEVSADSREAKSFLKSQEEDLAPEEQPPPSRLQPGPSGKRPGGMSSVLNRLGAKKQKMSTLEKSKMDWDCFKSEEGIGDELAIHNRGKEGYVERKNFLERVDQRQFEQEKKVRLGNMKR